MPGGGDAGAPLLAMPGKRQRRVVALDDAAVIANVMGRVAAGMALTKAVDCEAAALHMTVDRDRYYWTFIIQGSLSDC